MSVALTVTLWLLPGRAGGQVLSMRALTRGPLPAGDVLVDQVVAVVDSEEDQGPPVFVLGSEVELEIRFKLAAARHPPPAALTVPVNATTWRLVLEHTIGERMLERLALRAGDPPPTREQVESERTFLQSRLAGVGGIGPLVRVAGLTETDFDAFVLRRLVAIQFLQRHLPQTIEPSETDLRVAYNQESVGPFLAQGVSFAMARAEIREVLMRESYPQAVRTYLRSVGSRVRIRLWADGGV